MSPFPKGRDYVKRRRAWKAWKTLKRDLMPRVSLGEKGGKDLMQRGKTRKFGKKSA